MSLRTRIDQAPLGRFQAAVIGVCLVLNLVDGFDLLVMAFAAPGVAKDFHLDGARTGVLLSSSLAGMALGSALLAPLADRIGRRRLTAAGLALSAAGMAIAAAANGFAMLGAARFLTGIGIGGLITSLPVLLAEYAPQRRRGTVIALYTTGLPLGGVLGGAGAVALVAAYGWRGPFVAGAAVTALMLVLTVVALPESIDHLLHRRPPGALERINTLLRRMRLDPLDELPPPDPAARKEERVLGARTALLWTAFFVMMAAFYFAASWTPKLLEQSGLSARQGLNGGVLLNLGGVVAALAFSALALRFPGRIITAVSFAGAGLALLSMGFALGHLGATLAVAVAIGLFNNGSASGLFVLAPDMYPARVRATAVGWAAAVGRLGGIAAPVLAGVLVDRAWSPGALYALFAVPIILAAPAVLAMTRGPAAAARTAPAPVQA